MTIAYTDMTTTRVSERLSFKQSKTITLPCKYFPSHRSNYKKIGILCSQDFFSRLCSKLNATVFRSARTPDQTNKNSQLHDRCFARYIISAD